MDWLFLQLHAQSLVPRFLGSPPAALSIDCSAAPVRVLFPVLAEASQNGSFAGTSSNSVEVWSAKPVAAVCGERDAATRLEDFDLWTFFSTIGLRRTRTRATAQLMCDMYGTQGPIMRFFVELATHGAGAVASP